MSPAATWRILLSLVAGLLVFGVALILADMQMDMVCLQTGLLHDVVEDTAVSADEVGEQFGEGVGGTGYAFEVKSDLFDPGDVVGPAQRTQALHGRARHVDRIQSELRGGSAFFPGYQGSPSPAPPAEASQARPASAPP